MNPKTAELCSGEREDDDGEADSLLTRGPAHMPELLQRFVDVIRNSLHRGV